MPANVERDDTEWTVVRELAKAGFVNFAEPCIPECHEAGYGSSPPTPQSVSVMRALPSLADTVFIQRRLYLVTNVCTVHIRTPHRAARTSPSVKSASLILILSMGCNVASTPSPSPSRVSVSVSVSVSVRVRV